MADELTIYDKEKLFKEEIKPVMQKLVRLCAINKIPCFVTAAVKNNENGTKYISDMNSPVTNEIVLKENQITSMANVLNGFDVVATSHTLRLNM